MRGVHLREVPKSAVGTRCGLWTMGESWHLLDVHGVRMFTFRENRLWGKPKGDHSEVVQHQPGVHFRGGHRVEFREIWVPSLRQPYLPPVLF